MRDKVIFYLLLFSLALGMNLSFVFAQQKDESTDPLQEREDVYFLTMEQVSELALKNNFDIQLAKYDVQISRTDQGVAESIYDTVLDAEIKYRNNQAATTSTLAGTKSLDNDYNIGVSKKAPTGTTLSVDMTNNRNWTNSAFATFNPSHDSSLGLTVEQELGRNFLGIQDRGNIKITKLDIENSGYTSLEKIEQTLAEAQGAYWDLVLALEEKRIEEEMTEKAEELYALQQEKLEDGLTEAPEVFAAAANYKTRLNELKLAENSVKTKMNTLRLLLNIPEDTKKILPAQQFSMDEKAQELENSLKSAFNNRRDYKRNFNDIKSKEIKLSMKKNMAWPEINLKASLAQNGLGEHFKQAVTNITDENNPDFLVSLSFSFPLENTLARSELTAAKLEKAKTLINLKLIERKITIAVIDQVRTCNVYRELVSNNQEVVSLQTKKLEEEEKRFYRGRSSTDTMIRFQEDLLVAQLRAAQSKLRYYLSLIELRQLEGSLLNQYWNGEI